MRFVYSLLVVVFFSILSFSQSTVFSEDFESITASGQLLPGWTFVNAQTWFLAGYGHNSDKYAGWDETNAANHSITTPLITNPGDLTFWIAAYNSTSGFEVKVQVSSNGIDWIDKATFVSQGSGGDIGFDFIEKFVPLQMTGSYYIRWTTDNYVSGGFYIDDIAVLDIVPVELTSFTALANGKEVLLQWSTASELNNLGFEVQRKFNDNDFVTIGYVAGNGTSTDQHNYSFTDKNLIEGKFYYRLKQIDFDGTFEYSKVIEVDWKSLDSYLLEQNYPNPFNPTTVIGYQLSVNSYVTLTVYDVLGKQAAVLVNEEQPTGKYEIEFDGNQLSSGVYFYQLKAGEYTAVKKMLLTK